MKYLVALITALSLYLLLINFPILHNSFLIGLFVIIYYLVGVLLVVSNINIGKQKSKAIGWGIIIGSSLIVVFVIAVFFALAYSFNK